MPAKKYEKKKLKEGDLVFFDEGGRKNNPCRRCT